MITEVQRLYDNYLVWLKDKSTLKQVSDCVEITTPYLDRHNDYLQIYAKREGDNFLLTDGGYVIRDLELSGCKLDSPKRQALLTMTLNGFGVHLNPSDSSLEVTASADNFSLRKHNLVQAMLGVNDLFYLAAPIVASLFLEDVLAWLDSKDIRYTPNIKFTGTSGYDHKFDLVIPHSRSRPERIIQTINKPNKDNAQSISFAWMDTKEVRPSNSLMYAFLNDTDQHIPSGVTMALKNYGISPVNWSDREKVVGELAA